MNHSRVLHLSSCCVDLATRRVVRQGEVQHLSEREAEVLTVLFEAAEAEVSREHLLHAAFGFHPGVQSRALDTTVHRLRAKVEVDPSRPEHIVTVRGRGYRLVAGDRVAAVPETWVGRRRELTTLDRRLAEGPLVISGPPGIGKTTLMMAFGRSLSGRVVWLNARGCLTASALVVVLSTALGARIRPTPQAVASALSSRTPCLVAIDEADEVALVKVLALFRDCRVPLLVTTRQNPPRGVAMMLLQGLSAEEGARLLGFVHSETVRRAVAERLEGNPLALSVVSAALPFLSEDMLLRAGSAGALLALGDTSPVDEALEGVWSRLPKPLQDLLRGCATFADVVHPEVLAQILEIDVVAGLQSLRTLGAANLVRAVSGEVRLHALVRDFVVRRTDLESWLRWQQRHADVLFTRLAPVLNRAIVLDVPRSVRVLPHLADLRSIERRWSEVDPNRACRALLSTLPHAVEHSHEDGVMSQLAAWETRSAVLTPSVRFALRLRWAELSFLQADSERVQALLPLLTQEVHVATERQAGRLQLLRLRLAPGDPIDALSSLADQFGLQPESAYWYAATLTTVFDRRVRLGRFEAARVTLAKMEEASRVLADVGLRARCAAWNAVLYGEAEDGDVVQRLREALAALDRCGGGGALAMPYRLLALGFVGRDMPEDAVYAATMAVALTRPLGHTNRLVVATTTLATALMAAGRFEEARIALVDVGPILGGVSSRIKGAILANQGLVSLALGEPGRALEEVNGALPMFQSLYAGIGGQASATVAMALAFMGKTEAARVRFDTLDQEAAENDRRLREYVQTARLSLRVARVRNGDATDLRALTAELQRNRPTETRFLANLLQHLLSSAGPAPTERSARSRPLDL